MTKRIAILTGGGDCPGLNPAIRGVVLKAAKLGYECVGIQEGWKGMIDAAAVPLSLHDVKEIVGKGGTILGTSRTNPYKKEGGVASVLETFKKLGLHALVAMGGEDTLGVAAKLFKEHKVNVVGVPKTMDNDLDATDYTFGFDTAATIAVDAAERLIDTGRSHRRIMVLEVMGRHAGWVALYTAIGAGADYLCLPERPVDVKDMAAKLKAAHAKNNVALVVASEAVDITGEQAPKEQLDAFGHMILKARGVAERLSKIIEAETKIETRSAVIGHIQRGGGPTLFDRILGTRVGVKAAELAHEGKFGHMVALKGDAVVPVSLEAATAKLKTVTPEWLKLSDDLL
ncbi:MAG: pyrophosphate--fructose-6-phosphate 1-phosphotransferase [Elusimicrobia bacterium GWC2_65_9]|nr:MAG: pyrophosphate--fructose-6-phosphate 1-phosphotransferase [Elusimicrobia bacterium GWA2_66_18]OGR73680.1 MAG: pyrophosphate--fructose-6-phosphate 1-phosphotransferase [Elusimicrobia bacterium GWC2_65_9]